MVIDMIKKLSNPFVLLYFLILPLIYTTYIIVDFKTNYDSSSIKYSLLMVIIVYVFIVGLINIIKKKNRLICLLYILAFILTAISDYYLLIKDDYSPLSLTTFNLAHILYAVIIYLSSKLMNKKWLIIGKSLILVIGLIVLIITKEIFNMLICTYALNLLNNMIDSLILFIKTKEGFALFLLIGFILFIGCDICVALSNLDLFLDETKSIYDIELLAECIIWIFYGPSQFFISLSINRGDNNEKESV